MATDGKDVTGTSDPEYDVIWFTETCMKNALKMQTFIQDAQQAGNEDLVQFFRKAQAESRKGAELGKEMLRSLLSASAASLPTAGDSDR
jgi:hypothetical protein